MQYKTRKTALGLLLAVTLALPVYAASYGPVKRNETLWDIAARYRPSYAVSVPQMMAAFHAKNPHAFVDGDINRLKRGVHLQIPVLADARQVSAQEITASLRAEINSLRSQLEQERQRSAQLASELQQLKANSAASGTNATPPSNAAAQQQADLVIKLQTELAELKQQLQAKDQRIAELEAAAKAAQTQATANLPAAPAPDAAANAQLQAELANLKQLLEQRDTHIQNLQASLREASITIKRQFAEGQALHEQLKAVNPNATATAPAVPAEPGTNPPPSLTLAGTESGEAPPTPAATPVFTDQVRQDQGNKPAEHKPVSLQNMLEQQAVTSPSSSSQKAIPTPSRVSLAVALISLIFILALLWRSFSQRRSLQAEEARLRAALGSDS